MVDGGSPGSDRPAEQPTAEQLAVPAGAPAFQDEPVTSEFSSAADPSTSANGVGSEAESSFDPHPELAVGGAFIGGFLLGRLLRRLGR